jgi:hypothetical protein
LLHGAHATRVDILVHAMTRILRKQLQLIDQCKDESGAIMIEPAGVIDAFVQYEGFLHEFA